MQESSHMEGSNNDHSVIPHMSMRCAICRKKIGLMSFKCKCDPCQDFCIKHRYPEDHMCTFDYKSLAKERLVETNPVIAHSKIEKI